MGGSSSGRSVDISRYPDRCSLTNQLSKPSLGLLVYGVDPVIDRMLLLFTHFRVGSLLETLEDLGRSAIE
jgi:hypothetical protein